MKTLSLILCAIGLAGLVGCSTSSQTTAYKAESATQVTVTTAMNAWGSYVQQFNPPDSERVQVAAAYGKYQAAAVALLDAEQLVFSLSTVNGTNAAPSLQQTALLQAAQSQAAQAVSDLVNLIQQFGVKINK